VNRKNSSKNENKKKEHSGTKITHKVDESQRARGRFGPPFPFQILENTTQNIQIWDLCQEHLIIRGGKNLRKEKAK
jgi:hypothetical protein